MVTVSKRTVFHCFVETVESRTNDLGTEEYDTFRYDTRLKQKTALTKRLALTLEVGVIKVWL